ncbi:MAG: maltose alpha-D-glucosyltransferase [Thermomicrobiales bacterium]|nr:maltose alpha-D-glucosyltransferase [Thermomicrobiales bacterium]
MVNRKRRTVEQFPEENPLWYKDAVIYQAHVRAFRDSNADGIGDFAGLIEKLDYLQDLGVTAIWILPFYPSPLRDDGYDIADYTDVNPIYGTIRDARTFVREAHRRGLRVITELVFNHTSDQHAWFQRARTANPGTPARDFYVWSDTGTEYPEARIIFKDFEVSNWTWDRVAGAYYWHRFYSSQPDLNFDNPRVHEALFKAMSFWLDAGVDGVRLDAIPYLYEREGTNCENLPETHAFLKKVRAFVDNNYRDRMLLAEANQWPEDTVEYFGDGDECHMAFNFPVMPRLYMALRMEDRYPIVDILDQTPEIPDNCQWAMFLRNHDELTLEMVTDEERDYMYRAYAQDPQARINLGIRRRLAPLVQNNRRRIELLNGLLFSLPGTPIIYYGDEIGMGDNIFLGDRNGVRTPMQWSGDRNAGFSDANSQRLFLPVITDPEYHYSTVNVETQQANPQSLLWWMKRLIALRKRYRAFGRGTIEFLNPDNRKVLSFIRTYEDEVILVVANLSRFAQGVELDLSSYRGMAPVEMFGRTEFPQIGELPYFVTLGPHSFYFFSLEQQRVSGERISSDDDVSALPQLAVRGDWATVFSGSAHDRFTQMLPEYLLSRRWFAGKARRPRQATITDRLTVPYDGTSAQMLILRVEYAEGDPDTYVLPLAFATGERAQDISNYMPHAIFTRLSANGADGLLYDAMWDPAFGQALVGLISRRGRLRGERGAISAFTTRAYRTLTAGMDQLPEATNVRAEQSNSSVTLGDRLILKVIRRLAPGINPDLEIGRALTERSELANIAPVAGAIEYRASGEEPMTLGILQGFVKNEGDAWSYALDVAANFYDRMLADRPEIETVVTSTRQLLTDAENGPSEQASELVSGFLADAHLLGVRTAEMHIALSGLDDPAFAPESYTTMGQRSLYQSTRSYANEVFQTLRKQHKHLPDDLIDDVDRLLALQPQLLAHYRTVVDRRIDGQRIRVHGDYHLGQVLFTGRDFVIIDFEGEPMRPLSQRRIKRSPLRDVAGMLRSFDYAAWSALLELRESGLLTADDPDPRSWALFWYQWVASSFLAGYLETAAGESFLPSDRETLGLLLDILLLDKAIYELNYELNNRPDWVRIPLSGLLDLLAPLAID